MNDSSEDRILDSFLEEMLTNQRPPDLTDVIQQRLRDELGPEQFAKLRSSRLGKRLVTASPVAVKPNVSTDVAHTTTIPWTSLSVAVLTLAAGLMLAFAVWKLWPTGSASDLNLQANKRATQPVTVDPSLNKPEPSPQVAAAPKGKELPLDQLPFQTDVPLPVIAARPPAAGPVAAMQDRAIIDWLDERFAKLWDSQGVSAFDTLDDSRWLGEVSERLVGTASADASAKSPRELSEKLVRTQAFADLFSDRIAEYWLKGTTEASANKPAGKELRAFLAQQIVAKKPWNEVLSSLVSSQPNEPQSVWLATLAGSGNHRLASRIGSLMLDEALACARCHDASDNGRVVSMDQDDYWSLVAMFTGIDGKNTKAEEGSPSKRQLVDNQKKLFEDSKLPAVFFDRPDGLRQSARYRLPSGDDWRTMEGAQTPRESLARWISHSSITDQASVNLAWRVVFGRPLVAQHAALDGEGYVQRREILAMLAEQFQAHNRDLGQLVTWLVSSRPFARETLAVDRSRWLVASEDEIVQWNNAATNFAVRLPGAANQKTMASLETALARMDKWSSGPDDRRTTLAQPTPNSANKPKSVIKPTDSEPLVGYLIHSVKPTHSQGLFIKRLVKSKLTWEEQVDHIAGLVGEPAGNARLHSSAQKILDAKNGDRAAALFQLLQGALMCHEAL